MRISLPLVCACAAALVFTSGIQAQNCSWTAASGTVYENCGNVAIGATTANTRLDVSGGVMTIGGSNTGTDFGSANRLQLELYNSSGTQSVIRSYNRGISAYGDIGIGELTRLFVGANGAVGIGTTAPETYGPFAIRKYLLLNGKNVSASFSDAVNSTLDFRHMPGIADLSSENSDLTFSTSPNALSGIERMRIGNDGNIGIGTTAPTTRLDVNGDVRVTSQTVPSAGEGLELDYVASGNTGTVRAYDRSAGLYKALSLNDAVTIGGGGNGAVTMGGNLTVAGSINSSTLSNSSYFGVGTTTPSTFGALAVRKFATVAGRNVSASFSDAVNSTLDIRHMSQVDDINSENSALTFSTATANIDGQERMRITPAGYVGIATAAPVTTLDVAGDVRVTGNVLPTSGTGVEVDYVTSAALGNVRVYDRTNSQYKSLTLNDAMTVNGGSGGNVTMSGNLTVAGSITGATVFNAVYQDIAEWVPSAETLAPGTVVVLDPKTPNQVMESEGAYDTTVAGVVSAQPGVILGRESETKAKVATVGRVRVRVDATTHPVHIGDLLVTSDKAGMAMVSQPVDVAGVKMHRPGTLIGKALGSLDSGEGEVLVLLSLQ